MGRTVELDRTTQNYSDHFFLSLSGRIETPHRPHLAPGPQFLHAWLRGCDQITKSVCLQEQLCKCESKVISCFLLLGGGAFLIRFDSGINKKRTSVGVWTAFYHLLHLAGLLLDQPELLLEENTVFSLSPQTGSGRKQQTGSDSLFRASRRREGKRLLCCRDLVLVLCLCSPHGLDQTWREQRFHVADEGSKVDLFSSLLEVDCEN